MNIGGLDVATKTGLACARGDEIVTTSFRPSVKRPFGLKQGEVDFSHEGQVSREFRDYLRAWLADNEIGTVAIEKPLVPNLTIKKPVYDRQAGFGGPVLRYEQAGGTNFGTIFRIYALVGQAVEICVRMNITVHVVAQQTWRSSFMGVTRAPRGTEDGSKWLKQKSKEACERAGIKIKNADEADAAGIAFWLRSYLNPRLAGVRDDLFKKGA